MDVKSIIMFNETKKYKLPTELSILSVVDNLTNSDVTYTYDSSTGELTADCIHDIAVNFSSKRDKLIGFTDKHLFNFCDRESGLKYNSEYTLDVKNLLQDYKFSTKFSPTLCKVKDIKRLIGNIFNKVEIDFEEYIFDTSRDIEADASLTSLTDKDKTTLCANIVALDVVYQYYYKLLDDVGTVEDTVGTLKVKRQKLELKLDSFIARFKSNIDIIKTSSKEKVTGKSFGKASKTSSPLEGRLW